jgi:GNAT superfamily N-acetyltransferase
MLTELLKLKGKAIIPFLEKIGTLRLSVFQDYPYLYDGTLEDEYDYLETYARSESALITLAMDGAKAIGATTCLRFDEADPSFRSTFEKAGHETNKICYLGESVLLASYRGQGIGKQFFQVREEHAQSLGCQTTAFCAVDRAADHPLRPKGYRDLQGFWESQGYIKHPDLKATFSWKDVGETIETPKTLTFWTKKLKSTAA